MTVTEDAPAAAPASESTAPRPAPTGLAAVLGSGDHKVVGRLWLVAALVHLVLVGAVSVLVSAERIDTDTLRRRRGRLDRPGRHLPVHRRACSCFVLPLTIAVATVVVPLQVGRLHDRLPAGGRRGRLDATCSAAASSSAPTPSTAGPAAPTGTASCSSSWRSCSCSSALVVAWICIVTTVLALRTTGHGPAPAPLFAWSALVAGGVWILTLPVLAGLAVLSYLDPRYGGFLDGGSTGTSTAASPGPSAPPPSTPLAIPVRRLRRLGRPGVRPDPPPPPPGGAGPHRRPRRAERRRLDGPEPRRRRCRGSTRPRGSSCRSPRSCPLLGLSASGRATVARGQARPRQPAPVRRRRPAPRPPRRGRRRGAGHRADRDPRRRRRRTTLFGTSWSTRRHRAAAPRRRSPPPSAASCTGPPRSSAPASTRAAPASWRCSSSSAVPSAASPPWPPASSASPAPPRWSAVDNLDTIKTLDLVSTAGDGLLGLAGLVFVLLAAPGRCRRPRSPSDDPWSGHTLEWATARRRRSATSPRPGSRPRPRSTTPATPAPPGGRRLMATATDRQPPRHRRPRRRRAGPACCCIGATFGAVASALVDPLAPRRLPAGPRPTTSPPARTALPEGVVLPAHPGEHGPGHARSCRPSRWPGSSTPSATTTGRTPTSPSASRWCSASPSSSSTVYLYQQLALSPTSGTGRRPALRRHRRPPRHDGRRACSSSP